MAYQIALTISGTEISNQFESFTFARQTEVLLYKTVNANGTESEIHIPGRSLVTTLTLIRQVDAASSKFQSEYESVLAGSVSQVRATIVLTFSDTNGKEIVHYTFTHAFISSITISGNRHGGTAPEEQIEIAFDTVTGTFA